MGYLSTLYNSAKKSLSSGLANVGGVLTRLGSSGVISRLGGYVSAASPYISKGLEMAGAVFGQPEIAALGVGSGIALDYIGKNMTTHGPDFSKSMQNMGSKLNTFSDSLNSG
jgi:hypothetical protein